MTHPSAELLRRHRDEPDALSSAEKEHLLNCAACRAVREEIAGNANFAERALTLPPASLDIEAARRAVAARASNQLFAVSPARSRFSLAPRAGWLTAAAAAVVLGLSLSLAPVRSTAANFLAIFEPHSFQPIAITKSDMEALNGFPNLSSFGNVQETGAKDVAPQTFSDVFDAMRVSRQAVLHPRYLPTGIPDTPTYTVLAPKTGAFTFSAAKARAAAQSKNAVLPPMPANLDGSTLYATFAPTVITTYGSGGAHGLHMFHHGGTHRVNSGMSGLAIFQSQAPRIYSTGASVRDIVDYLLAQPGISPSLAAQIRAIGDPSTTLPIPIPVDKALAQTVSVGGSPALVVGDETGVGSVVVWERAGMVYGVVGPLRESELLAVANSLTR